MRWIVLGAILCSVACEQAPTSPDPPPPPLPTPVAHLVPDQEDLTITQVPGPAFAASATFINAGPDCADHVSGLLTITVGATVYPRAWALPDVQVVQVNERVRYDTCCLPATTSGQEGSYWVSLSSTPQWCP